MQSYFSTNCWLDPNLFNVCWIGIGGAVVGLLGLLANRGWVRIVVTGYAAVGCLFGLLTLSRNQPMLLWAPALGLGTTILLVQASTSPFWHRWRPGFSSRFAWSALLIFSPALAFLLVIDPMLDSEVGFASLIAGGTKEASTDRGDKVIVRHTLPQKVGDANYLKQQIADLNNRGLAGKVIPLGVGWLQCNCHGWVFTGGQFFLSGSEIPTILNGNNYFPVTMPLIDDLVVYYSPDGEVLHSGIVRYVGEGLVLVESKWGENGLFLHPADVHAYHPAACVFYRSPRAGHLLNGLVRAADNRNGR